MSEMYLPNCQKERSAKREFRINIRETLETQVTIEAESEEEALREVERRWKDGEYILDADNFQGVNFWADGLDNLKPCPFCGGRAVITAEPEAVVDTEGRRWGYTVVCNRCCATSGLTYSPDKAREAWNRRAER